MSTLTQFLGWCTVINFGFLLLASIFLTGMRGWVLSIHTKLLGVSEEDLLRAYVQYLSHYKIAIVMLNLVPWIALKLMV